VTTKKPTHKNQNSKNGKRGKATGEGREYDASKTPFSWDKLDGLLACKSTLVTCSDILDVSTTTIKDHIKKRFQLSFTEYADKKLSRTKVKLAQKALQMAFKGDRTMLIFSLKNINKWVDNPEPDNEQGDLEFFHE
jgi:hypothetical protein